MQRVQRFADFEAGGRKKRRRLVLGRKREKRRRRRIVGWVCEKEKKIKKSRKERTGLGRKRGKEEEIKGK